MSDLIYRQAAIELLLKWADGYSYIETPTDAAVEAFRKLPSAEPDSNDMSGTRKALDTISRQAAIDALNDEFTITGRTNAIVIQAYIRRVNLRLHDLPSVQPEIIHCRDCKYASPNGEYGCKAYHFKLYETHEMKADDFCSKAERRTDE